MHELDGYCDVFDTRYDCLGLKDTNTWLATFIDWQWAKVVSIESEEFCHILKGGAFLCSCKGTMSFTVCRMKSNAFVLLRLPIDAVVVDENNDFVERLARTVVSYMITVNINYQTVLEVNFFKFGRVKINT